MLTTVVLEVTRLYDDALVFVDLELSGVNYDIHAIALLAAGQLVISDTTDERDSGNRAIRTSSSGRIKGGDIPDGTSWLTRQDQAAHA